MGFPEAITEEICIWLLGCNTMIQTNSIMDQLGKDLQETFFRSKGIYPFNFFFPAASG